MIRAKAALITETRDVREFRRAADQLLSQLQADRVWIQQRLSETGRLDPLEQVSGQSALDRAILTMRDLIRSLDELGEAHTPAHVEVTLATQPMSVGA